MKIAGCLKSRSCKNLLAAGVLGDSLGSLRNGVLGKLSRKDQTASSLDWPGRDCLLLVVGSETRSFSSNSLKEIIDEGVHDGHGLLGDTNIGVNLLQHLVDVRSISLLPCFLPHLLLGSSLATFLSTLLWASLLGAGFSWAWHRVLLSLQDELDWWLPPKFQAIYTLREDQNLTFENAFSDAIGTSHIQTYSNRSGSKFEIWKRSNLIYGRNRNRPLCWKDLEQNLSKAKGNLTNQTKMFKMPFSG